MKMIPLSIGVWALSMSAAVIAAETSKTTVVTGKPGTTIQIIKVDASGKADGAKADGIVLVPTDAKPDGMVMIAGCEGKDRKIDTNDQEKGPDGKSRSTRIIMCNKGDTASVDVNAQLAEARKQIAEEESLSADMKAKVLASLDAAIARQKAAPAQ